MAKKKRRPRRRKARKNPTPTRRRRRRVANASPVRRRRRRTASNPTHHRRRRRRNPSMFGSGTMQKAMTAIGIALGVTAIGFVSTTLLTRVQAATPAARALKWGIPGALLAGGLGIFSPIAGAIIGERFFTSAAQSLLAAPPSSVGGLGIGTGTDFGRVLRADPMSAVYAENIGAVYAENLAGIRAENMGDPLAYRPAQPRQALGSIADAYRYGRQRGLTDAQIGSVIQSTRW
jgi:hypothetical protein